MLGERARGEGGLDGRGVGGAADQHDVFGRDPVGDQRTDGGRHILLAPRVVLVATGIAERARLAAEVRERGHVALRRLGARLLLEGRLPERLELLEARRGGERGREPRVVGGLGISIGGRRDGRPVGLGRMVVPVERDRRRQVAECQPCADGLARPQRRILGRVLAEGVVGCAHGVAAAVGVDRHRRRGRGVEEQRDQRARVGGPFDEHGLRAALMDQALDLERGGRGVMPHGADRACLYRPSSS